MMDRRRALAGLATLAAGPAHAASTWEPRGDIPWPAQEVYGTVWRGRAVIAGGMAPGLQGVRAGINPLDRTGIYDPAQDTWAEGPRLPRPKHHPVLATARDRVFAFGGFAVTEAGGWVSTPDALVMDGEAWRPVAEMPRLQCETVAVTLDGRVHLISGRAPRGERNVAWGDQGDIDRHQLYDPSDGRWTTARPCPLARNSAAGAEIGGKLYLVGGRRVSEGNSAQLDVYDPGADRWDTLRPMPRAAGGLAAAALGGRLYAFGGEGGPGVIPDCWSYDPKTDGWRAERAMRTPRHGLCGVAAGGVVLAIGGGARESGGQVTATVEALRP